MVNSKWIRRFAVWTAALLAAIAAVVVIFDPFYHFHGSAAGDESSRNEIGISVYRHNTEFFL